MQEPKSVKRIANDYGVPPEAQQVIISQIESHFDGICLDASSGVSRKFADDDIGGIFNYFSDLYSELGEIIDFVVSTKDEYDSLHYICGTSEVYRFFDPPMTFRKDRYYRRMHPPTSLNFIILILRTTQKRSMSEDAVSCKVIHEQLQLFS